MPDLTLSLNRSCLTPFLDRAEVEEACDRAVIVHRTVLDGSGAGADMLGWRELVLSPDENVLTSVEEVAAEIRDRAEVLLCIGIGGSYLGAQAVIDALCPQFQRPGPEVIFAGHHLSASYHGELLEYLDGKSVYVNVISKSGGTLEPALAFRFARRFVEEHFSDPDHRIIVTTGPTGGRLNPIAEANGYRRFIIPDGVGGRFSVLTPVGLLPIAAAGLDARALFEAAGRAMRALESETDNPALQYASDRFLLHEKGFVTEVMAVMEPRLAGLGAWWQQLFGESEGKDGKGLFPAVAQYTTDLHSIGQYIQDGQRNLIETFLTVEEAGEGPPITVEEGDPDGLNYLAGMPFADVNWRAYEGTAQAHLEGGVPNSTITLSNLSEDSIGQAIAFFEHAVAVSGYLLEVDPFDQPGVEAYKQKMFELLGHRS